MKLKARLRSFNNIEDEVEGSFELSRHPLMTYQGIIDKDEEKVDGFCKLRASKCLHGLYDSDNLAKNIRMLDQVYGQNITWDTDFDERYFINLNGLQHTPIKLKSPLQNFPFARAA